MELYEGVLKGEKSSVARLITLVENGDEEALSIYERLYSKTGKARKIGITGPPGVGKSTLLNLLIKEYLDSNFKTAVIAVDPSSTYTGGAILGDRVRMQDLARKRDCFVRSMASRGALGGISNGAFYAADILDAAGYDYIFIETVGIGQSEIDIVKLADVVVLVTVPDLGDEVQALKAGVMEIGDLIVINKSDREGAERTLNRIKSITALKNGEKPGILLTDCIHKEGIKEFKNEIELFLDYMVKSEKMGVRRSQKGLEELKRNLVGTILDMSLKSRDFDLVLEDIISRKCTPNRGARMLIKRLCSQEGDYDI